MILNQSNTEVLTIISQNPIGLNTADIFKRLVETYKDSAITTPSEVSKVIWTLRGKAYITSLEDGKKKTHKITRAGEIALNADSDERLELAIVADMAGTELVPVDSKPIPATPLIPVTESLLPALLLPPARLSFTFEELEDLVGERIQDFNSLKAVDLTGAVSVAKQAGYTVLDPDDDLHAPFITIINIMETNSSHPGITHKELKINTLQNLINLLSDDISTVLGEIVTNLNQLEGLPA